MARGFLAGAIWGVVASGIGAGTLSVMVGMPQGDGQKATDQPSVQSAVLDPQNNPVDPQPAQEPNTTETPQPAPIVPAPAPRVSGAAPTAPVFPAPEPQTAPVVAEDGTPAISAPSSARPADQAGDQVVVVDTTPAPVPAPPPTQTEPEPTAPPRVALSEPTGNSRPSIGKPAGSLLDKTPAVPQGRLPKIGQTTDATTPDGAPAPDTPVYKFAAPMPAVLPAETPKMSVILVDDGAGPLGPEMLNEVPFPISFAIGVGHPDPAGAVAQYRARGFEVLALTAIPSGAQASDIEVTLAATLDAVPDVVGLLEAPGGGLQDTRDSAAQATSYLAQTGHGLVVQSKGLNTAQKLAVKEGVPSVTVFRDLDGEGQDPEAISHGLQNAAFRARQEGGVVTMARLNGTTWSALFLWGLQDRNDAIALVPVSHLLQNSVAP
ncbi:MAG: divergent polysaccharide deacetylase family protein [Pelagimonas sp.]|jgi:polysaccharide deacetylase 2 family uncharacterized protein YibQ|nr:divergent polysaccharide deacetylase family protein [Pelagimonas sp.]